jgi:hypothetical protein
LTPDAPFSAQVRSGRLRWALPFGLGVLLLAANAMAQEQTIPFDISAGPLEQALEAYGAATGFEVFYDAALAAGHTSAAVKGTFTPVQGLQILLHGTNYVPRATGPNMISISIAPAPRVPPDAGLVAAQRRFESYFAKVQSRVDETMCDPDAGFRQDAELVLKLWLGASGEVSRAETLAAAAEEQNQAVARLRGLRIGAPPPANMPQPVTLIVFPPRPGEPSACASAGSKTSGPSPGGPKTISSKTSSSAP